jgi:cobaltochelatase CobN
MHLLATEPGMIADGSAAVDLGQTPGDIVVLASADTEIALLEAAQAGRRKADSLAPSLRLAPVMRLGHNLSVDVYMDNVARARLVVGRLLGGSAYWPYGVERLVETCRDKRIPLALLPGDDKPDPELARLSTVGGETWRRLWRYLAEGGPGNADNFLRYAAFLLNERSKQGPQNPPHPPAPTGAGPSLSPQAGRGALDAAALPLPTSGERAGVRGSYPIQRNSAWPRRTKSRSESHCRTARRTGSTWRT